MFESNEVRLQNKVETPKTQGALCNNIYVRPQLQNREPHNKLME
jgi:hypothetical protein